MIHGVIPAQVSARTSIYLDVRETKHPSRTSESVRCLSCRRVYDKPAEGGTANSNPGCPACGYVGWLSVLVPVPEQPGYDAPATA